MKRLATAVLLLLAAADASAATERRIRAFNVGAQAVMTLVSGLVQHKPSFSVVNCLASGAAGGYGAFAAKIQIRNGHIGSGWLLANAAASLSENAAAGMLPWKQLGYTVGPLRLRLSFDRTQDAYAYLDASVYETAMLFKARRYADSTHFRSGMIAFERRASFPSDNPRFIVFGKDFGIYPGVWIGNPDPIRVPRHEVIHAVQCLQGDAVEPFDVLTHRPGPAAHRRLIRFEHLKLGLVNPAIGAVVGSQAYENRWTEIEAYRLAQRMAPPTP